MTSHFLYPSEDKACMNVQYAYACFYLVHTLVARRRDKERSRLVGGRGGCGTDWRIKEGNVWKTWKNKQEQQLRLPSDLKQSSEVKVEELLVVQGLETRSHDPGVSGWCHPEGAPTACWTPSWYQRWAETSTCAQTSGPTPHQVSNLLVKEQEELTVSAPGSDPGFFVSESCVGLCLCSSPAREAV